VLWSAGRILEVPVSAIGAGILLLATAPVVIYQAAIISNDAPSVLGGSLVALLAALAWKRPGRWTVPTLGLTALVLVSIKTTELFPVTIAAILLLMHAWNTGPGWDRHHALDSLKPVATRWMRDGGALVAGGVAAAVVWVVVQHQLALVDPKSIGAFNVLRTREVSSGLILREALYLLGPTTESFFSPGTLMQNLQFFLATLVRYTLVAGALAGLFVSPRRWFHWLGIVTIPALLGGGYVFGLGLRINYAIDPGLSGRYALPVAPLLVLALVGAAQGRWVVRVLWAVGLASLALTLGIMI
jgi:hypothetical protein